MQPATVDWDRTIVVIGGLFMIFQFVLLIKRTNNEPLEQKINEAKRDITEKIKDVEKRVEDKINGWAARIDENREDITRLEGAVGTQAQELVRSQEDRKRLNERQVEINSRLDALGQQVGDSEGRLRDKIDKHTQDIMAAINQRRPHA